MTPDKGLGTWIRSPYEKEKPFLQQIPREAADYFILKSHIREYDKGEVILQGNSEGEYFYVLQSGRIQICGEKYKGQFTEIAVLEKGSCFGEMSLLSDDPISNTVLAMDDCTVLHMGKADFIRFISDNPAIIILLYKILADRLRAKNKAYEAIIKTGLMGHARVLSFVDLAQSFEKSRISATIFLGNDRNEEGFIAFTEGRMYCAQIGKLYGADALESMIAWGEQTFFRVDESVLPDKANLPEATTTSIILDVLRNIDERAQNPR